MQHWRVLAVAFIISCGTSFHYGYQLTVINPTEKEFRIFINDSHFAHYGNPLKESTFVYLWPAIVNLQTIGGFLGTFFIRVLLEKLGRKRSFYVTTIASLIACLMQGISKYARSYELFSAGRLLIGIAQGTFLGLQPVYLNEISPITIRGIVGSTTGALLEFGFFFGAVLALPNILGSADRWPYLFAVEAGFSLILLIALPFFPESPKFLASKGDYRGAADALLWFGNTGPEVDTALKDIRKELSSTGKDQFSIKDVFRTPYVRRGVLLGWMVLFSAAYSGIMALSYFSSNILERGGLSTTEAGYGTVAITALCFIAAFIGGATSDKFGRRPILLITNGIMLILNILLIVFAHLNRVYNVKWAGYANIAMAASFTFTYGFGPAVIMWYITSEMMPQKARSVGQYLAMVVHWLSIFSTSLIFYPLQSIIHEFCFLLHIVPLLASILIFYFRLPETKNKKPAVIFKELGYKGDYVEEDEEDMKVGMTLKDHENGRG